MLTRAGRPSRLDDVQVTSQVKDSAFALSRKAFTFSSTGSGVGVAVASGLAARALAIGNERHAADTNKNLAKRKFANREGDFVAVFIEAIRSGICAGKERFSLAKALSQTEASFRFACHGFIHSDY